MIPTTTKLRQQVLRFLYEKQRKVTSAAGQSGRCAASCAPGARRIQGREI